MKIYNDTKMKKEYILKFCHPQITIKESAKEDFKKLMGLSEESFLKLVFVRFSKLKDGDNCVDGELEDK